MPEEKNWFMRAIWGVLALIAVVAIPSCFNEANASAHINYPVKQDETLSGIAKKFCGDYQQIALENGIQNPDRIYAGRTVLRINNRCNLNASPGSAKQSVSPEKFARSGGASQGKHFVSPEPVRITATTIECSKLLVMKQEARSQVGLTRARALQCIDQEYGALIREASRKSGITPQLIRAKIYVESSGNPNAISAIGCKGLLQVCPATARGYGVSETRLFEPRENILGGTRIFEDYLRKARGNENLALAYYATGPYSKTVKRPGFDPASLDYTQRVREIMRS